MATLINDLRYGIRSLLRRPGFCLVVIGTLALGIGANTALFSIVNSVLLNPLPYPDPDQIVTFHQSKPNFETGAIPYPNFLDLQKQNQTFAAMAISRNVGFSLIGSGEAERISGRLISADFFAVLGVKPDSGRLFSPADDHEGAAPVALISHGLWERKFNAARDVTERTITLDDKSYEIVGVLPASFNLVSNDVYIPIGQWSNPALKNRGAALGLHGIGRLKPGVSIQQGQADLERVMRGLAVAYPETNRGNSAKVISLKQSVIGNIGSTLLLLLGAVGFVLLIACVNVSNLMLAHSTSRTREIAIRGALGAGRWHLLRQSIIESVLLALWGGVLGLLAAEWSTRAALSLLPSTLPRAEEIRLDARVLLFALGLSLVAGILSGLGPALKASRSASGEILKEGARGSSGRSRAQGTLVAIEMALALVLLIGAGLMMRSLQKVWTVDPGFRPDHALTFGLTMAPSMRSATPALIRSAVRDLSDRLSSVPGVKAVSFLSGAAPLQTEDDLSFWIEGQPKPSSQSEMNMALIYVVEPGYLSAMGLPLKRGRFFTPQDDERSLPVAVIDETLARKYFGTSDPVGRRLFLSGQDDPVSIVGVVSHVKQWGLDNDDSESLQAQLYLPFRALPDNAVAGVATGISVVIRSDEPVNENDASLLSSIRQTVQSANSQNVISRVQTMNEVIALSLGARRFSMILIASFAGVALLLASLGIYGVISYLVGQRTHELGIRIALGAERRDILRLVLGHGLKLALAGVALGLIAAFGLTRLIAGMLFGVGPNDPITFSGIALLLTTIALLACYVPARRATRVDPLVALRNE